MKQFSKKYQLWIYDNGAYNFTEFDTLEECMSAHKLSDWYITKRVALSVKEADEIQSQPMSAPMKLDVEKPMRLQIEAVTDAEKTMQFLKDKHKITTSES